MRRPDAERVRITCRLLGIEVTPVTIDDIVSGIEAGIRSPGPTVVLGHNLHSAYLFHTDNEFSTIYTQADIIIPDGAPVVFDLRLTQPRQFARRIGSTDWLPHLDRVDGLGRVAVVGADAKSNEKFVAWLRKLKEEIAVLGIPGNDWSRDKERSARAEIEVFRPDLVILGLGMPRQEYFAARLLDYRHSVVIAVVGGAIDQISGFQRNAPRWLGPLGLEWVWRLATQPRRLWRRYLIEPWKLLGVRLRSILTGARH